MKSILGFYRQHSVSYAKKVKDEIEIRTLRLKRVPRYGRMVPDRQDELRELIILKRFRVVSSFEDKICTILAVIDGRRDFNAAFEQVNPQEPQSDDS